MVSFKKQPPLPNAMLDMFLTTIAPPEKTTQMSSLAWAKRNATLVLPVEGRVPFDPYPYQAHLMNDHSLRRIVLKARQTGLSNCVALEALHTCLTEDDRTILFVSRNKQAAGTLITYCKHTLANLTVPTPKLVTDNQSELRWANGSRIVSLSSTKSTGRSFAATRVYLDEFAFCAYDVSILESILPTLAHGGSLTVLSTPNGRSNMFYRLWEGLEGGDWSRHTVHWSDCPRYDLNWAARTRAEMTEQAWAQEYDLDFIASGLAVFNPDDLKVARSRTIDYLNSIYSDFITAWDIGRKRDPTVGITIGRLSQTPDWEVVAFERFIAPYPIIQAKIDARCAVFRYGTHIVESNGVGDPVIENLEYRVRPFMSTPRTKLQAIQALQLLIEQHHFYHNEDQLDRELNLYQWDDKSLVQDCVMAAAIAAYATLDNTVLNFGLRSELSGPSKWPTAY